MSDLFYYQTPHLIAYDREGAAESLKPIQPMTLGEGNVLDNVKRRQIQIASDAHELTACSPVIPHDRMQRIRDNVVREYTNLYNNYSNIGGSLDARGFVQQYHAVFDATEGGNYCYYTNDQPLVDDIVRCAQGSNIIFTNTGAQYTNNFAAKMVPLRNAFNALQQAASNATNDIRPALSAYKELAASNFPFNLYTGLNGNLDNLLAEYSNILNSAGPTFDQAANRVQTNFEGEAKNNWLIYTQFLEAYSFWDLKDGAQGYASYKGLIPSYNTSLSYLGRFVVLDTARNRQIWDEVKLHIDEISVKWQSFPTFVKAMSTRGFMIDPGTSALKFFSRQLVLNLAEAAGSYFISSIATGKSLIGTGFSYEHGGKMPPHKEHKTGKDCDIWSEYFVVGGDKYDENKATKMVVWLLQNGVTRVIYTNNAVVTAANKAVPGNPVAVEGVDHKTHIHFDVEHAT